MAKRYRFGAVRLLGLLAVLYGVTGIVSDLTGVEYTFSKFELDGFLQCLADTYFMTSAGMFEFVYYMLFTVFGIIYVFNTKPSMKKAGFNPKAYAMIGFAFLFVLQNLLYFMVHYPFDFSMADESGMMVARMFVLYIYCSVGELLMIIALMNYLRGGKVIRPLMFVTFLMAFIFAILDGLVGIEALIDAVRTSNGGISEVSALIYKVSLVLITFFLLTFSFSHDRILRWRRMDDVAVKGKDGSNGLSDGGYKS